MKEMKETKTWIKIQKSFWFQPALYGILSILLAIGVSNADAKMSHSSLKDSLPELLIASQTLATEISSMLAQATLAMMSITFSAIMIVLTTFSGQFSPRTLQNFISDRNTQRVLAIFVAGISYNLVNLLLMKPSSKSYMFISPIIAILFGLLCVAAFVYFINHVAKWVQVNNLIDKVTNETSDVIDRTFKAINKHQHRHRELNKVEAADLEKNDWEDVYTTESGYIEIIDIDRIITQAMKDRAIIRLRVQFGDYVIKDKKLLSIHKKDTQKAIDIDTYRDAIKVGTERSSIQDIEFGLQKLVEIALRAISPAINDPHTAINCINRLGTLLSQLGKELDTDPHLFDSHEELRLVLPLHDYRHYLYKSFYQIRHYAKDDVSVMASIFHVFGLLTENADETVKRLVWTFAVEFIEGVDRSDYLNMDHAYLREEVELLKKNTGREDADL